MREIGRVIDVGGTVNVGKLRVVGGARGVNGVSSAADGPLFGHVVASVRGPKH